MSGFYQMHRGWQEADVFGNAEFSERDAWVWLIEAACWQPTTARIKGAKVPLDRGQMTFAQRFLADKWHWSKSRVDRFLKRLTAENMISTCSKNGATAGHAAGQGQAIITICNYDKYQAPEVAARGNAQPQNGATAGQQRGKEEEGKKERKKETPPIEREGLRRVCVFLVNWVKQAERESIVAEWNAMATAHQLPLVSKITEARRVSLDARIAEHGRAAFTEAISRIAASPMCRGENNRGWKANFDFVLQPSSFLKLIEGNYDGNTTGHRPMGGSGQPQRHGGDYPARRPAGDGLARALERQVAAHLMDRERSAAAEPGGDRGDPPAFAIGFAGRS